MMENKEILGIASIITISLIVLVPFSGCLEFRKDYALELYDYYENECIVKGWQKITIDVDGLERQLLWKGPEGSWEYGAIIALHGGGSTYAAWGSNCSKLCEAYGDPTLVEPQVEFSNLSITEGFAVFALDSTYNVITDENGYLGGKRFDYFPQDRANIDVPFIETVITEIIPNLRPLNSSLDVFITGISTGGFMTTLTATHLDYLITAFAPVAGGDPYGIHSDFNKYKNLRIMTPGVIYDRETSIPINKINAAVSNDYPNELEWPETIENIPFKQFHHREDAMCDISCMDKIQYQLIEHGYIDDGPYILEGDGKREFYDHMWMEEYNQPMIDFFKNCSNTN
ncbi:MAG: hypothetical protein DRP09_13945 [Candidatus Thorarchaeota archaeon]|nr:MAG: hypothetical protein DRP09_13945 [Candidatus Thorarchaeota archaeon]